MFAQSLNHLENYISNVMSYEYLFNEGTVKHLFSFLSSFFSHIVKRSLVEGEKKD